jgi:cyclopropane fatty-acyl-phospholipid synthase-like methyltransferase
MFPDRVVASPHELVLSANKQRLRALHARDATNPPLGARATSWLVERQHDAVLRLLLVRPGDHILGVGCGRGDLASRLHQRGALVHGCDLSEERLARVRPYLHDASCADFEVLDLGREFEAVLCVGGLEFSDQPKWAFATLARHVRMGGQLVLLVPVAGLAGRAYAALQFARGLRVHVFHPSRLTLWAVQNGLALRDATRRQPHCGVFAFEKRFPPPPDPRGPLRRRGCR